MKLETTMCYSRLLFILDSGKCLEAAISKLEMSRPDLQHEGLAGYIETKVTFYISDLQAFTNIYNAWNMLSDSAKLKYYGRAKGLG